MAMSKKPERPAPRRCAKGDCNKMQPCPTHYNKEWANTSYYKQIPEKDKNEVRRLAGGLCRKCGRPANPGQVDHIVNVARGGQNEMSNYQLLCLRCHKDKTDKEIKWGQRRRR